MKHYIAKAIVFIEFKNGPSAAAKIFAIVLKSHEEKKIIYSKDFSLDVPGVLNISDSLFRKSMKFLLDNKFIIRNGNTIEPNKEYYGK